MNSCTSNVVPQVRAAEHKLKIAREAAHEAAEKVGNVSDTRILEVFDEFDKDRSGDLGKCRPVAAPRLY